jgi:hypothetical protein
VIPWDAFEDRARFFHKASKPTHDILTEDSPEEALVNWFRYALDPGVAKEYGVCKWLGQPYSVELWVEKDALAGFLSPLCKNLGVGLIVSRGYTSITFKQEARRRFKRVLDEENRQPVLLYLGDLDPSGYDIFRCLEEELGDIARVSRIGLLPEDVQQFALVSNPIKDSDPRSRGFSNQFADLGGNCYELDALPPGELRDRAKRSILQHFDPDIEADNQKRVRHWRTNFCDHQEKVREILAEAGLGL